MIGDASSVGDAGRAAPFGFALGPGIYARETHAGRDDARASGRERGRSARNLGMAVCVYAFGGSWRGEEVSEYMQL